MKGLQPPNSLHLVAAHGWLELGDHVAAFEELKKIEPELRGHPDVLEVRAVIYAKAEKWDFCVEIGSALVRIAPERPSGWLKRSHALQQLGKTQDAYDQLKPAQERFKDEWMPLYNLACYACVLGNITEARELIEAAIELGGSAVKLRALEDQELLRVWAGV